MRIKKPIRMSLSAQVVNEIERHIEEGIWKVGEKIPPEPELVEQFGVSRNTLREAIQALIHGGLLEAKQGDGTYILSNNRLSAMISKKMSPVDIIEVLEVRNLVEKEIVRKACLKATDEQISELEGLLIIRNQNFEDWQDAIKADMNYHLYISQIAGNHLLSELYKSMYCHMANLIEVYFQETKYHKQDELHNGLFNAIKNRNEEQAAKEISELIELEKKVLIRG